MLMMRLKRDHAECDVPCNVIGLHLFQVDLAQLRKLAAARGLVNSEVSQAVCTAISPL